MKIKAIENYEVGTISVPAMVSVTLEDEDGKLTSLLIRGKNAKRFYANNRVGDEYIGY